MDSKFLVLKWEDIEDAANKNDLKILSRLIRRIKNYRELNNKSNDKSYLVIGRDKPYAEEVKAIIEKHEGKKIL